jgi:hypothetical protein
VLDLVLALVLVAAVFIGLRRGLVGPLVGELGFLVAVVLTIRFHAQADRLLTGVPEWLVTPVMTILLTIVIGILTRPLVGLLRRVPVIGSIDRSAGAAANGVLAFLLIYWAIGAVLDFDRQVYPTLRTGLITAQQIEQYRGVIAANPVAKQYANDAQIRQAERIAAQNPLPVRALQQVEQFLDFYVRDVRDPLLGSKLAPIINDLGGRLPLVGHPRPWLQPFGS